VRTGLALLMASAFLMVSACSDSSPTGPTSRGGAPIAASFVLTNPGTLSLSDPIPCSGDGNLDGCPHGLQPQGAATTTATRTEHYNLAPGTYVVTGRVQGTTPQSSASVRIAFARGGNDSAGPGVDRSWSAMIVIGLTGEPPPVPPSITADGCVKTITNVAGGVEWGVVFRVMATTDAERLCQ
jgi:hypothetical protein